MITTLTYLFLVLLQDHFFQWLEEISWKLVYLDFSVKNFLLRKFFQYLSQIVILPTDLLKRNNFQFIHRSRYSCSNWSFYSRVVYGREWDLQQFFIFCSLFAVKTSVKNVIHMLLIFSAHLQIFVCLHSAEVLQTYIVSLNFLNFGVERKNYYH